MPTMVTVGDNMKPREAFGGVKTVSRTVSGERGVNDVGAFAREDDALYDCATVLLYSSSELFCEENDTESRKEQCGRYALATLLLLTAPNPKSLKPRSPGIIAARSHVNMAEHFDSRVCLSLQRSMARRAMKIVTFPP
ncbi:unnamed protein product [Heligmosomoides polygyrus]|uniref:Uncharacterized protein n=1 Tax=Heligmosomoides polygyrus TaxID=6339 RepID=A0A183GRI1_HELPZ|nr:unnamed protein product [Heligmosomoides polygyrus]